MAEETDVVSNGAPKGTLESKGRSWREALNQLKISISGNLENVSQLHQALEEYEATVDIGHQELDFLQSVDLQLVQNVFDDHEVMASIAKGVQKLTGARFCD